MVSTNCQQHGKSGKHMKTLAETQRLRTAVALHSVVGVPSYDHDLRLRWVPQAGVPQNPKLDRVSIHFKKPHMYK
jgi:hypothetical protein